MEEEGKGEEQKKGLVYKKDGDDGKEVKVAGGGEGELKLFF